MYEVFNQDNFHIQTVRISEQASHNKESERYNWQYKFAYCRQDASVVWKVHFVQNRSAKMIILHSSIENSLVQRFEYAPKTLYALEVDTVQYTFKITAI